MLVVTCSGPKIGKSASDADANYNWPFHTTLLTESMQEAFRSANRNYPVKPTKGGLVRIKRKAVLLADAV